MSEFTDTLQRELARLEGELQQDPRYRRIQRIRELLADYRGESLSIAPARSVFRPVVSIRSSSHVHPRPKKITKEERARQAVQAFLHASGGTAHRTALLAHLIEQKIMGSEKNAMLSLASYLSDWKNRNVVGTDGKGTWFLKETVEKAPQSDLPLSH